MGTKKKTSLKYVFANNLPKDKVVPEEVVQPETPVDDVVVPDPDPEPEIEIDETPPVADVPVKIDYPTLTYPIGTPSLYYSFFDYAIFFRVFDLA